MLDFARVLRLAAIDKVLIILFCIYAVWLICVIFRSKQRRKAVRIDMAAIAEKIASWLIGKDDEPFDPTWMDAERWRQTRP